MFWALAISSSLFGPLDLFQCFHHYKFLGNLLIFGTRRCSGILFFSFKESFLIIYSEKCPRLRFPDFFVWFILILFMWLETNVSIGCMLAATEALPLLGLANRHRKNLCVSRGTVAHMNSQVLCKFKLDKIQSWKERGAAPAEELWAFVSSWEKEVTFPEWCDP